MIQYICCKIKLEVKMLSVSQNGYCKKFIILYCTPAIVLGWCSLKEYRLYIYSTVLYCTVYVLHVFL